MAEEERKSPWYTLEEAADYLRVSERTMRNLVVKEQVTVYRVSPRGPLRFKREDLDGCLLPDKIEIPSLNSISDPVLAELWDNEYDAIYDKLYSRQGRDD